MAVVKPFHGILYNPGKVDVSAVTAPPYDIVTPTHKDSLYEKDPHNIIRIDFGKDNPDDNDTENRYTRAAGFLKEWLSSGILTRDDRPCFYCYEITYRVNGEEKKTRGFMGAVKLEELGRGSVHPHEMTYSKPKSDRLNILRYCRANISPVFSIYSSPRRKTSSILETMVERPHLIASRDGDGFIHRLWRIDDPGQISAIEEEIRDLDIFIADGHHRYETALAYKRECEEKGLSKNGDEPFNYIMMFLANMDDEGLTLLPTHRIVEVDSDIRIKDTLREYFDIEKVGSGKEALSAVLDSVGKTPHSFGMFLTNSDTFYSIRRNSRSIEIDMSECLKRLDVSVLHRFVFEKLLRTEHFEYEMDPVVAIERAKQGSFEAVFFLKPTEVSEVREVALAGERMPPKSTYFFPKLLTGMVMYSFE
jgi:uncharacterized protein (DUF1015 family)